MIKNNYTIKGDVAIIDVEPNHGLDATTVTMDADIFKELDNLYADGWDIIQHAVKGNRKIAAHNTNYIRINKAIFPLRPVFRGGIKTILYLDGDQTNLTLDNIFPIYTKQTVRLFNDHVEIPAASKYTGKITLKYDYRHYNILKKYGTIGIRQTHGSKHPWVSVCGNGYTMKANPLIFKKKSERPLAFKNGDVYDFRSCNIVTAAKDLPYPPASEDHVPNPVKDTQRVLVTDKLYLYERKGKYNKRNVIMYTFYTVQDGKLVYVYSTRSKRRADVAIKEFVSLLKKGKDDITAIDVWTSDELVNVEAERRRGPKTLAAKIRKKVAYIPVPKHKTSKCPTDYTLLLDKEDYEKYLKLSMGRIKVVKALHQGKPYYYPAVIRKDGTTMPLRKFLFGSHLRLVDGDAFNLRKDNLVYGALARDNYSSKAS